MTQNKTQKETDKGIVGIPISVLVKQKKYYGSITERQRRKIEVEKINRKCSRLQKW